ncbi:MAG: tetratricopeptide repeat protein [Deltaproteobacteria bacterium]|nr:MAG: tetratricopeptide repeat protein [Deltaproteobacteria bacterium]
MGRFEHIAGQPPPRDDERGAGAPVADAPAFVAQARKAQACGAFQAALRLYGRALEEDRFHVDAWLGQVQVLLDMGQPEEAATWMEQAARVVGEVPGLLALRALAASRRGALDEARQWSDRAMRDGADRADVWLARAAVVYSAGNGRIARVNLDKAHERDPGPDTARRCAEVALDHGDLGAARTWLTRADRADPDNPLVALRLGVYHERQGDLAQARHHLERALQLEPRLEPARLALEDLDRRGPWARLRAALRRWSRP